MRVHHVTKAVAPFILSVVLPTSVACGGGTTAPSAADLDGASGLPPCDGVTCRACIHQPDCSNLVGDQPYECSCDGGALVCIDPICEKNCVYGEGPYTGTPCDQPGLTCAPSSMAVGCNETCTCDGHGFVCPGCGDGGH